MKYEISCSSIAEIAEGFVLDYLGGRINDIKCIDIEGMLADYFGLRIVYESFAEDDPCRDGYIADGERKITVWRNGRKTGVVYPKGTVVFDRYLLRPEQSSHRRFCMAHECGHNIFANSNARLLGAFHTTYASGTEYSLDQMREMFSIREIQANRMGAALLLPRFLVLKVMQEFFPEKTKIPVFARSTMYADDRKGVIDMADQLGVSVETLMIQLEQYDLLIHYPMDDLIDGFKREGGWGDGAYQYTAEIPD